MASTPTRGPTATCSAPGKVFVAGGYAVLQGLDALVFSTSARFTAVARASDAENQIEVISVQFSKRYYYSVDCEKRPIITKQAGTEGNPYLENTLNVALQVIQELKGQSLRALFSQGGLAVELKADNDFYSHREELKAAGKPLGRAGLRTLPPSAILTSASPAKTGLGSSAALVSALTGAVLEWGMQWPVVSAKFFTENQKLVHNVAQLAHCKAQGKIGSGFDVSSAIFGSQVYRRFDPKKLEAAMAQVDLGPLLPSISEPWYGVARHARLPNGMRLVLGECGKDMNTVTSVRKVLDWSATSKYASDSLFQSLDKSNRTFTQLLETLDSMPGYQAAVALLRSRPGADWRVNFDMDRNVAAAVQAFLDIQAEFFSIRKALKLLGDNAGTSIEPPEMTSLLNHTMRNVPGVLCAGCPGAGGYDAIFAIVLDEGSLAKLEDEWINWAEMPVSPLLTEEESAGISVQLQYNSSF